MHELCKIKRDGWGALPSYDSNNGSALKDSAQQQGGDRKAPRDSAHQSGVASQEKQTWIILK